MHAHIENLRSDATSRTYKRGSNILFQGEVPRRGFFVTDGVVRAYGIASSGEEQTVALYGRGDIAPLSWLMGTTSNTLFYYQALTDVRISTFTKELFEKEVLTDEKALRELVAVLSNDHIAALLRINGLTQSRADEKIAYILYYLLFRYGKKDGKGMYKIDLTLRHATLASLVGLSRESTTKTLGILQRKGVVSYSRGIYSIDKKRLEDYIGEDTFRDMVLR